MIPFAPREKTHAVLVLALLAVSLLWLWAAAWWERRRRARAIRQALERQESALLASATIQVAMLLATWAKEPVSMTDRLQRTEAWIRELQPGGRRCLLLGHNCVANGPITVEIVLLLSPKIMDALLRPETELHAGRCDAVDIGIYQAEDGSFDVRAWPTTWS